MFGPPTILHERSKATRAPAAATTPCDEEIGELDGDARQYVRHTGMTLPFQAPLALPPVLVLKEYSELPVKRQQPYGTPFATGHDCALKLMPAWEAAV